MSHYGQSAIVQEAAAAPAEQSPAERPIRVMIVDDSAVVRGLVARWIEEEPGLEVAARHANGKYAVEDVVRSAPDIILLDVEMPVMDGLEALPLLLRARPDVRILMVSTLTKRNAEISFKALALGALDYVPKPETNREITTLPDFREEVIRKVRALGAPRGRAAPLARCRKGGGSVQAAGLLSGAAAGDRHRQFHRRPAGVDEPVRNALALARPHPGPRRAAYAADVHDDPGRAPGARHGP